MKEKIKNKLNAFKEFAIRGNVFDMAVGVIVGGAFGKIVTSMVNDILTPILGIFLGGLDFSNLSITVKNAEIKYGSFIQQIIDFLIIASCIFFIIELFNKINKKKEEHVVVKEEPKKSDEVVLLEQILDELKKKN